MSGMKLSRGVSDSLRILRAIVVATLIALNSVSVQAEDTESTQADVVVGGTPGGLMAAIVAACEGRSVIALERSGHGAVLIYFRDISPGDKHYAALQFFALRGFFFPGSWAGRLDEPITPDLATRWIEQAELKDPQNSISARRRAVNWWASCTTE